MKTLINNAKEIMATEEFDFIASTVIFILGTALCLMGMCIFV